MAKPAGMARRRVIPPLVLALALACLAPAAAASTYTVGSEQTLVTAQQRTAAQLKWWPDGPMGVQKTLTGYVFNSPNGPDAARSTGTLDNPIATGVTPRIQVAGARDLQDLGYASGGPLYEVRTNGSELLFLHLERYPTGDPKVWYGSVGLARSTDDGRSWRFLGEILTSELSYSQYRAAPPCGDVSPATFGQYVIRDVGGVNYFYAYDADVAPGPGCQIRMAVARAPVSEVVAASKRNTVSPWFKYYDGGWTQPGLGGASTDIWTGPQRTFAVSYNAAIDRYLMVMSSLETDGRYSLEVSESVDGIAWSTPTTLFADTRELYAPTIVGTGRSPATSGASFYVYYTSSALSPLGGFRWDDGSLRRRLISVR
jgi:hypothetical protein